MRTAIAVGDYHVSHETMVNRHIRLLFGGDTCVIAGRLSGDNPYDKAVFERRGRYGLADSLRAPFALTANRLRYSTSRPPFGQRKRELAAFLRREKVEAVLAEFGTQVLAVAPLAHEMGLPVFTFFRGTDASKSLSRAAVVEAYRRAVPKLDGVFSVSQSLLDNLARHGIGNDNAHVLPSGVDVRLFQPGAKRPKSCVSVGRMVEKKAPLTTLRAFATAAKDHPEARLTMVGGGPLLDDAKALAAELGVSGRVTFPGHADHEGVRRNLSENAIFLQHSVTAEDGNTEGLPTAIQEAMACGCVIVSTRHAGIPEAVTDGETGYLVDERDEAAFADRIGRVLAEGTAQMAANARKTAEERYDNDVLLGRLEEIMEATVRGRANS